MGYFQTTRVLPSVYRIDDPRGVSMTLLVGEKEAFLCDTCMGMGSALSAVRELTDLPLTVANTHAHLDHAGGNYQFERVYLPRGEFPLIKVWSESEELRQLAQSQRGQGVPEDFDAAAYLAYRGENLEELEPGRVFDLGGLTVETVPLPGHTAASMGYLCRERELLLTGDAVSPAAYLVFPESLPISRHIEMLEWVKTLPFTHILSSHHPDLIPKEKIDLFLDCARSVDPAQTVPFRNPMFPHIKARMFIYANPNAEREYVSLSYVDGKLDL